MDSRSTTALTPESAFSLPFRLLIIFMITAGTVIHLSPLLNEQRLLYSINDDGYYMLTIAKNIAEGKGMSIADGTIKTNGTQPLMTLVFAIIYLAVNGDKISAIWIVVILQWLTAAAAALLLWKAASNFLGSMENRRKIAALSAAAWYSSPVTISHTMNGLETGLYSLAVIYITLYLSVNYIPSVTMMRSVILGLLLGAAFWVRNDSVFLIIAVCAAIIIFRDKEKVISKSFSAAAVTGLVSALTALPWLLYNAVNFGSIVPVSGRAQSYWSGSGGSLVYIPVVLFEYFSAVIPVPGVTSFPPVVSAALAVVYAVLLYVVYRRINGKEKAVFLVMLIFLVCLVFYYGLFYESHINRYLFPATPFLMILWALASFNLLKNLSRRKLRITIIVIFIGMFSALTAVKFNQGSRHSYYQFVEWAGNNTGENVWVGSPQSGMLGYFHDRTINLDGKVNPEALPYLEKNELSGYCYEKNIEYVIEWASAEWFLKKLLVDKNYYLYFSDSAEDIVVYRRKEKKEKE